MSELQLKYGCNPNQSDARVYTDGALPFEVLNGRAGYINLLDALNSWQLVRELREAAGLPAAASFKHVSPAGAAVGEPLDGVLKRMYFVEGMELSPLACAYARARGADRMSSYGDWAACSDTVDVPTAKILARENSDGIIAPGYEPEALAILKSNRKGAYCVIRIDQGYVPAETELRTLYGVTFEQRRNDCKIDRSLLQNIVSANKTLPDTAARDLIVALTALKYTQSNSVAYAFGGQAIGIGAGQQSRIHCTRLAGSKADFWFLRRHPAILELEFLDSVQHNYEKDNLIDQLLQDDAEDFFAADASWSNLVAKKPHILSKAAKAAWIAKQDGVSMGSDAHIPFDDNIERARRSGVRYVAETGGSIRDGAVTAACDKYGMVLALTGLRLFYH